MTSTPLLLRALLTVAFVAAGGFCLRRCVATGVSRHGGADRVDDAWHVVMTALMVASLWAAPRFPDWQAAVLAIACGWFVARAVVPASSGAALARSGDVVPAPSGADAPAPTDAMACVPMHRPGCAGTDRHESRRLRCVHHAVLMGLCAWMIAGPMLAGDPGMGEMRMPGGAGGALGWGVAAAYCIGVSGFLLIAWVRGRGELTHAVMAAGMGAVFMAMA